MLCIEYTMNPAKFFIQVFYNHVTALKLESRLLSVTEEIP